MGLNVLPCFASCENQPTHGHGSERGERRVGAKLSFVVVIGSFDRQSTELFVQEHDPSYSDVEGRIGICTTLRLSCFVSFFLVCVRALYLLGLFVLNRTR